MKPRNDVGSQQPKKINLIKTVEHCYRHSL